MPGLRNPSLMALAIDLVIEVAVLMKRCNDFSIGINQPTLEKLEKFKKDYALRVLLISLQKNRLWSAWLILQCAGSARDSASIPWQAQKESSS